MVRYAILVLAAGLLSAIPLRAEQLRWKFKEGDRWQAVIEQELSSAIATSAREREKKQPLSQSKFAWHTTWTVREVGAESATIGLVFDALAVEFRTGKSPAIRYDSRDAGEPAAAAREIAAALGALVKAEIAIRVTPRGEVRETIVPPATDTALRRAGASGRLRELLSADGFQRLLAQAFPLLPEKPVAAGEKWSRTVETTAALGKTQTTYQCQFTEVIEAEKARLAKLALSAELAFEGGKASIETKTMLGEEEVKLTTRIVEQTSSGTALFDLSAGRFAQSELTQTIAFETTGQKALGWQELVTKTRLTVTPAVVVPAK